MTARVHYFGLERQSFQPALPVSLLHDDADVNLVARPVDPAFGKDERVEIFRQNIVHAVDVEARKVQLSTFARIGNERHVVAVACHEGDRCFLADRFLDRRESGVTIRIALRALDRDAVFP